MTTITITVPDEHVRHVCGRLASEARDWAQIFRSYRRCDPNRAAYDAELCAMWKSVQEQLERAAGDAP
jgi:hypothetical protein